MPETDAVFPAHLGQRHLWLRDRFRGGEGLLAVPIVLRLRGPLNLAALERALGELQDRHEPLRTTFSFRRGLVQTVHPPGALGLPLTSTDLSGAADPEAALWRDVVAYLRVDADLRHRPVSAALWTLAPQDHLLVLNVHHLVTDGWSNMLLLRDLAALYSRGAEAAELPPIGWTYREYAHWYAETVDAPRLERHRAFWRTELEGARGVCFDAAPEAAAPAESRAADGVVAVDVSGREEPRPRAVHTWFELDPGTVASLRALARAERGTLYTVLLTGFFLALREISGQTDLTIGSIFANRGERAVQETVGMFANLALVRARLTPDEDPGAALAAVRRFVLRALAHQELPYPELPQETIDKEWPGRPDSVVFQMLAVPQAVPAGGGTGGRGLGFAGLDAASEFIPGGLSARFDLELTVLPSGGPGEALRAVFRHAEDGRHTPGFVEGLIAAYRKALDTLAALAPAG